MDDIDQRFQSRATQPKIPSPERPVVLVNHLFEPPGDITGVTRYTFGLLQAMIRRADTRIILVTTWAENQLPAEIATGIEAVVTLPYVRPDPLDIIRQRMKLGPIARKYGADIVYGVNPMCPPVRGIPSIITVYDLYLELIPKLYKRRRRLWWKLFFPNAARRAAGIAVISASTATDLVRFHPSLQNKTHIVAGAGVLPHSNNDSLPAAASGRPYVLLLGNITPNKNIGFALEALRMLARQGRGVRALHVGRDPLGDLSHDDPAMVQTLGSLDDKALDSVLRNATALVQPSRHEGFGLTIVEALERGVPVVATDIAIFREVAGDGCILVGLDNVPQLADAVHSVTTDPSLRAELSAKARANGSRFTWDKSAQAAVAMINELYPSARGGHLRSRDVRP